MALSEKRLLRGNPTQPFLVNANYIFSFFAYYVTIPQKNTENVVSLCSVFTPKRQLTRPENCNSPIMGYYYGPINDIFEPEFEAVIYKFQAENGLGAYGVLDISTQVKIENIFYKIRVEVDDQLKYAYEYLGGDPDDLDL